MARKADRWKKGTLFDPGFLNQDAYVREKRVPYSLALEWFGNAESPAVPEDEVCIFRDVLKHEIAACELRGYVYGPLSFVDTQRRGKRLRCMKEPCLIPGFVEPDVLPIAHCDATAIVLIEDHRVFDALIRSTAIRDLRLALITGCGIPRLAARRLIHRLERECHLPVLLLTDSDTWGYWIYSVLKRGLMAPGRESSYAAIRNVSFLGVRAGDWKMFKVPKERLRPWKKQWDLRLSELRKQRCFQSKTWQAEFDRFKADHVGLDLRVFIDYLGVDRFVSAYPIPRLDRIIKTTNKRRG